MRLLITLFMFVGMIGITKVQACENGEICKLENDRHYRILLPASHDKNNKVGAIFFAHGLGGSSASIINNQNLIKTADKLGVALVALEAKSEDWNLENSPEGRSDRNSDENKYLKDVIADVTTRFKINKQKLMLAGVSVGGTFTWTMACMGINNFSAYMPISGTYWLRPPSTCSNTPKNIIHIHGTADRTVPLGGRKVGSSAHSDVLELIAAYSRIGQYSYVNEHRVDGLSCSNSKNLKGEVLEFCLHNGGHNFRAKDIEYVWRRFVKLGIL